MHVSHFRLLRAGHAGCVCQHRLRPCSGVRLPAHPVADHFQFQRRRWRLSVGSFRAQHITQHSDRPGIAPGIHIDGTSISMANDQDWYRFEVYAPATARPSSEHAPCGNLDMDVVDANGRLLGRSTAIDAEDIVNSTDLAPGVVPSRLCRFPELPVAPIRTSCTSIRAEKHRASTVREPAERGSRKQLLHFGPGQRRERRSRSRIRKRRWPVAGRPADRPERHRVDTGTYVSGTAVLTAADAGAVFAGSPTAARWLTTELASKSTTPVAIYSRI